MDAVASKYLEYMVHGFYNGLLTLKKLENLNDDELETVYALGYNYFVYGKYQAAKDIFTGLTVYAPDTAHYWRALGATYQQLKDYARAITSYDKAIANDETDVVSYVYRGESKILAGNIEAGLRDFRQVLKIGPDYPQFEPWVDRSKLLIDIHREAGNNPSISTDS